MWLETAGLPIVNANVLDPATGKHLSAYKTNVDLYGYQGCRRPSRLVHRINADFLNWDKANLEGKVVVRDSVEAIRDIIPEDAPVQTSLCAFTRYRDDKYEKGEEMSAIKSPACQVWCCHRPPHEFPSGNVRKYPGVDGVNGKINGTQ